MVESIFSKLLLPAEKFSSATGGERRIFPLFSFYTFSSFIFFLFFIIFPPAHALAPSWLFRRDFFFFSFFNFSFFLFHIIFIFPFFFSFLEGRIVFPPLSIPPVRVLSLSGP
jgi:hypothetical protein